MKKTLLIKFQNIPQKKTLHLKIQTILFQGNLFPQITELME